MRPALLIGLMVAVVLPAASGADEVIIGRALARDVHALFKTACVECHGEDLAKPKGKFGYVLDLERVAANEDYIVRGNPDQSSLYQMIRDNEMPGEESKVGSLNDQQKSLVRLWIAYGAPGLGETAAITSSGNGTTPHPTQKAPPSPLRRSLRWLGQLHPAVVHFPIALFLAAALAHVIGSLSASAFCLRFSLLTAPLAGFFGWLNADFATFSSKSATLLAWHRWLGVSAAAIPLIAWWVSKRFPNRLRAILIAGSFLVLAAGALGGALTHGLDHYRW
jgi:uncharacterized membrane protein